MLTDPRCPEDRPRRSRRKQPPSDKRQADLHFPKPRPMTAAQVVETHLLGVLPPGVPPSFQAVTNARFDGRGRQRVALADLAMLDGLTATVEVFQWGPGAGGHRWRNWEGAALLYDGGRWQREDEKESPVAMVRRAA